MTSVSHRGHRDPQEGAPQAEANVVPLSDQRDRGSGGKRNHSEFGQVGPDPTLLLEGVDVGDLSLPVRTFVIRLDQPAWNTT